MGMERLTVLGLGMIGVLSVFVAGCDQQEPTPASAPAVPRITEPDPVVPRVTDPAEAINMAPIKPPTETADKLQIVDLDDIKKIIAEADAADQVLVIDFWATWCVPCIEMFPGIHAGLVERGATGQDGAAVRAVTVTMDDPSREASAIDFLQEHDALHDAYIFVSDSAAQQALADGLGDKWNSLALPAILVYDSQGNLAGEFLEGGLTQTILDQVDRLLASGQENQP